VGLHTGKGRWLLYRQMLGTVRSDRPGCRGPHANTADPSRELSVGDVVVSEVSLAVGRVGWTLVCGGLTEVRAHRHGTQPPGAWPDQAPDQAQ
jgi:hypothetical protein